MNKYNKGFAAMATLLVILGVIVLGGAGYVALNLDKFRTPATQATEEVQGGTNAQTEPGDHPGEERAADTGVQADTKTSIAWRFVDAGESAGIPLTAVSVVVNGTVYEMGKFSGSCKEIDAKGGIDGKGLLAGELSAVQCWFAGGGNEIGVFAHEDGGFDILTGELSEGEEGAGIFRGNFSVKNTIPL